MRILLLAALASMAAPAFAQSGDPDFVASRPGATEGAIAVPAGYFQMETEIASYARTRDAGFKEDDYSIGATTFRYGLGDGYDVELVAQPYLKSSASFGGFKDNVSGIGDVTLRVLKNISGQDGNGPAVAVIGYVSLPSGKDGLGAGRAEAGGILTGSFALADSWGAAWTVGAAARHMGGGDYQPEGSLALQLNHAFSDAVSGYVEVAANRAEHDVGPTAATFDIGAAWLVGPTTQLDAGVNLGITDAAPDASVFVGWAHRF